jgi:hypothetical protein
MFFIFTISLVVLIFVVELGRLYKSINNVLYTEGISKLGYIKSACNRMYIRGRNEVVYIEFASC